MTRIITRTVLVLALLIAQGCIDPEVNSRFKLDIDPSKPPMNNATGAMLLEEILDTFAFERGFERVSTGEIEERARENIIRIALSGRSSVPCC